MRIACSTHGRHTIPQGIKCGQGYSHCEGCGAWSIPPLELYGTMWLCNSCMTNPLEEERTPTRRDGG